MDSLSRQHRCHRVQSSSIFHYLVEVNPLSPFIFASKTICFLSEFFFFPFPYCFTYWCREVSSGATLRSLLLLLLLNLRSLRLDLTGTSKRSVNFSHCEYELYGGLVYWNSKKERKKKEEKKGKREKKKEKKKRVGKNERQKKILALSGCRFHSKVKKESTILITMPPCC